MTPDGFAACVEFVEATWPTRGYKDAAKYLTRFQGISDQAGWEALNGLFAEGRHSAPTLSEWYAAARAAQAERKEADPLLTDCDLEGTPHRWAILEESNGRRLGRCVVCGLEQWSSTLRTASELQDRRQPYSPEERIAP